MFRILSYLVLALGWGYALFPGRSSGNCSHAMSCLGSLGEGYLLLAVAVLATVVASVLNLVGFLLHRRTASLRRKLELMAYLAALLLMLLATAATLNFF